MHNPVSRRKPKDTTTLDSARDDLDPNTNSPIEATAKACTQNLSKLRATIAALRTGHRGCSAKTQTMESVYAETHHARAALAEQMQRLLEHLEEIDSDAARKQ